MRKVDFLSGQDVINSQSGQRLSFTRNAGTEFATQSPQQEAVPLTFPFPKIAIFFFATRTMDFHNLLVLVRFDSTLSLNILSILSLNTKRRLRAKMLFGFVSVVRRVISRDKTVFVVNFTNFALFSLAFSLSAAIFWSKCA
jgi:hypothetical protein